MVGYTHPTRQTPPHKHTPPEAHPQKHNLWEVHPLGSTPTPPRKHTPWEAHPPKHIPWKANHPQEVHPLGSTPPGKHTPPEAKPPHPTVTAADGTHPTGMLRSSTFWLLDFLLSIRKANIANVVNFVHYKKLDLGNVLEAARTADLCRFFLPQFILSTK